MPDSGGTWALPRLVGLPRALGMALTGEPITAERALNQCFSLPGSHPSERNRTAGFDPKAGLSNTQMARKQ